VPHVFALLFAFVLTPTPSPTISPLPSAVVQWYAARGAAVSGLDPALVRAVIDEESGGDPRAVSKAGAVGMMQLEPETAGDCGIHNRFNPLENVECGSKTLAYLVRRYGIERGLASYNFGAGNVRSIGGHFSDLPTETQGYVKGVILEYDALQHLTLIAQAPPTPALSCASEHPCHRERGDAIADRAYDVEGSVEMLLFDSLLLDSDSMCSPEGIAYGFAAPSASLSAYAPSSLGTAIESVSALANETD
jgi:hypothetical protein